MFGFMRKISFEGPRVGVWLERLDAACAVWMKLRRAKAFVPAEVGKLMASCAGCFDHRCFGLSAACEIANSFVVTRIIEMNAV